MSPSPGIGAVLFAKDMTRCAAFYASAFGMLPEHPAEDHVVLVRDGFRLVVHAIPATIAATIEITDPPTRRSESAVKLVFPVASIAGAREKAALTGGLIDPPDREWNLGGVTVCDGVDPEGNVVQVMQG